MSRIDDIDTLYAVSTGRKTFFEKNLDIRDDYAMRGAKVPVDPQEANLISSEIDGGLHRPVIDCDYPITAIASSTAGHYHLYIDRDLTWTQYKALLDGMRSAGLIEAEWYRHALADKRSYVRLPNVRKPAPKEGEKSVSGYFAF